MVGQTARATSPVTPDITNNPSLRSLDEGISRSSTNPCETTSVLNMPSSPLARIAAAAVAGKIDALVPLEAAPVRPPVVSVVPTAGRECACIGLKRAGDPLGPA